MSKLDPTVVPDEHVDRQLKVLFKAAMPTVWPNCPRFADSPAQTSFWSATVRRRFALAASIVLFFLAQMWLGTAFVGPERSSVSPNSPTEAHRRTHRGQVGRVHNPPANPDDRRLIGPLLPDSPRENR